MKIKKLNRLLWVFALGPVLGACQDDPNDVMRDPVDESFYATKLGGETRVADPDKTGTIMLFQKGYRIIR